MRRVRRLCAIRMISTTTQSCNHLTDNDLEAGGEEGIQTLVGGVSPQNVLANQSFSPSSLRTTYSRAKGLSVGKNTSHSANIVLRFVLRFSHDQVERRHPVSTKDSIVSGYSGKRPDTRWPDPYLFQDLSRVPGRASNRLCVASGVDVGRRDVGFQKAEYRDA